MRRGGARWGPGARDLVPIGVHTPAEASAAVTLQREEVALLATLRDVEPGPRVGVLGLGKALLQFTGFQPRTGVLQEPGRGRHKVRIKGLLLPANPGGSWGIPG